MLGEASSTHGSDIMFWFLKLTQVTSCRGGLLSLNSTVDPWMLRPVLGCLSLSLSLCVMSQ
jgi:hypothetical protein